MASFSPSAIEMYLVSIAALSVAAMFLAYKYGMPK